jgi:chromosomal replication initiation ATPase DnaA
VIDISTFSISAEFELRSTQRTLRAEGLDANFVIAFPVRRLMTEIAAEVLREHPGITMQQVLGDVRKAEICRARHHIWHQIRQERYDISLSEISRKFRRDHHTIIHGIKAHGLRLERERKAT